MLLNVVPIGSDLIEPEVDVSEPLLVQALLFHILTLLFQHFCDVIEDSSRLVAKVRVAQSEAVLIHDSLFVVHIDQQTVESEAEDLRAVGPEAKHLICRLLDRVRLGVANDSLLDGLNLRLERSFVADVSVLVERIMDLWLVAIRLKLIVAHCADLQDINHLAIDFTFVVDDEHVSCQHSEQNNLAVVLGVQALGRLQALSVEKKQILYACVRHHIVWELKKSEIDSASAPTGGSKELGAKGVIHERTLAGGLRTDDSDDDYLVVGRLSDALLDEQTFELEIVAVNQLECVTVVDEPPDICEVFG